MELIYHTADTCVSPSGTGYPCLSSSHIGGPLFTCERGGGERATTQASTSTWRAEWQWMTRHSQLGGGIAAETSASSEVRTQAQVTGGLDTQHTSRTRHTPSGEQQRRSHERPCPRRRDSAGNSACNEKHIHAGAVVESGSVKEYHSWHKSCGGQIQAAGTNFKSPAYIKAKCCWTIIKILKCRLARLCQSVIVGRSVCSPPLTRTRYNDGGDDETPLQPLHESL